MFILLAGVQGANAATYYVAKTGNDANNGTEAYPWLTVNYSAQQAAAGDTVYVKTGTYSEEIWIKNNGTVGNYITFQNHSTNVVNLVAPIKTYHLWGAVTPYHHAGQIEILGKSYIKIKGFNFTGYNTSTGDPFGVIVIEQGSHDIIIDGNLFNDFDSWSAIMIGYFPSGGKYGAWNIDIINNYFYRNALFPANYNEIISMGNFYNSNISYNTFAWSEGMPIVTKDYSFNITISYNTILNSYYHAISNMSWSEYKAPAIYVGGWRYPSNNISVFGNFINTASTVGVGSECGGLTSNMYFYNNIMMNGYYGFEVPYWIGLHCLDTDPPPQYYNIQFYNNVAYNSSVGTYTKLFRSQISQPDIIFRNNIAYGTGGILIQSGNTQDHNSWNNASFGDPRFINPNAGNFHLNSSSPAINASNDTHLLTYPFLPSHLDADGFERLDGYIDMGAYEWGAATNASNESVPVVIPTEDNSTPACIGINCASWMDNQYGYYNVYNDSSTGGYLRRADSGVNLSGYIYLGYNNSIGNITTQITITNCSNILSASANCSVEYGNFEEGIQEIINSSFVGDLVIQPTNTSSHPLVKLWVTGSTEASAIVSNVTFNTVEVPSTSFSICGTGCDSSWSNFWYEGKP